jgi:hypothetical protein
MSAFFIKFIKKDVRVAVSSAPLCGVLRTAVRMHPLRGQADWTSSRRFNFVIHLRCGLLRKKHRNADVFFL